MKYKSNFTLKSSILFVATFITFSSYAQTDLEKELGTDPKPTKKVTSTFKSTRLINAHSNETIYKNELDFRVDHRFGDIAGSNGGLKNFFGLDNSTDIRIGFDYGISDRLTVGLARLKGATAATQLYEESLKYRLIQQTTDESVPVSITVTGSATISAVKASDQPTSDIAYTNFEDRISYVAQAIIARKFSTKFSLAIIPSYVHRNYTAFRDQNDMLAMGVGGRLKLTNRMAFVMDYFVPFRNKEDKDYLQQLNAVKYYNTLGAGLEFDTGGHIFHLNFTNATGIQESQFIPQTTTSWLKGQYRWGFSIARRFSFAKKAKV